MTFTGGAAVVLVWVIAGATGLGAQVAAPAGEPNSPAFRISLDLNLVVLPVTVSDPKGGFASDLRERDFQVYEEGERQTIRLFRHEDVPVTAGLVIDHSGSMRNKFSEVMAAANSFILLSNPQDQMFVVNFSDSVSVGLPNGIAFSNSAEELGIAINRIPLAGQTALYDAVGVALDQVKTGNRDKKVLVIVSDGGDNKSVLERAQLLKRAAGSDVVIYAIGIYDADNPDQDPSMLRKLAHSTGGEAYFPAKVEDVVAICERIAYDIRHQYTLGYVSTRVTAPGDYRTVRVVARSGARSLGVRTRAGYVAGRRSE